MKKKVNLIYITIVLLLLIPGFNSCVQKDKDLQAEAAGDKVVTTNENVKKDTEPQVEKKAEKERMAVVGEPEGKDFLLYEELLAEKIYPEDFEIGLLQNEINTDSEIKEIIDVASVFINELIEGRIESDLISSDKKDFVERNLADVVEAGVLTGYRLGLIKNEAQPVNAQVRFESHNDFFKGTIYFIREGKWKIYDLHMDFDLINEE